MSKQFQETLVAQLPRLRAYALALTRSKADADDLMQTTALLALRAESQFAVGTNFGAWLNRILRNTFLDSCRKGARRPLPLDDISEDAISFPERTTDHVMSGEIMRAIRRMEPGQQQTLDMVGRQELSYDEAAALMSCSVGTFKSRLWRARTHLKAILEPAQAHA